MRVDGRAFRAIVKAAVGAHETGYREGTGVGEDDARAVLGVCALVAGADGRSDADERSVLGEITRHLGPAVPDMRAANDDERLEKLREVAGRLSSTGTRELAYALAYCVSIADLELAPAESELLADLAVALGITEARADELAAQVATAITPA